MAGFRIETAQKLAKMAGVTERRHRRPQSPPRQAVGPPGEAEIYKVHTLGIAARSGTTVDSALCILQTLVAGELVDVAPAVERELLNLSPNKIEGLDPSDGTSPMYCLGWPIAGGLYVASPMPWKTQATTIQIDTRWTDAGLDKKQILAMPLPVKDAEDWDSVATRDTKCDGA